MTALLIGVLPRSSPEATGELTKVNIGLPDKSVLSKSKFPLTLVSGWIKQEITSPGSGSL